MKERTKDVVELMCQPGKIMHVSTIWVFLHAGVVVGVQWRGKEGLPEHVHGTFRSHGHIVTFMSSMSSVIHGESGLFCC